MLPRRDCCCVPPTSVAERHDGLSPLIRNLAAPDSSLSVSNCLLLLAARTALATATAEARAQAMTAAMESRLEQFGKETKAELEGTPAPSHKSVTP